MAFHVQLQKVDSGPSELPNVADVGRDRVEPTRSTAFCAGSAIAPLSISTIRCNGFGAVVRCRLNPRQTTATEAPLPETIKLTQLANAIGSPRWTPQRSPSPTASPHRRAARCWHQGWHDPHRVRTAAHRCSPCPSSRATSPRRLHRMPIRSRSRLKASTSRALRFAVR